MKELINAGKWQEVFSKEETLKFTNLVKEMIANATDRNTNYADIMLAMYNVIGDAVYDYELESTS